MKRFPISLAGVSALLYAFLYAPILVVIVYSFNAARFGSTWGGFTTRWYAVLMENPLAWAAARNTLILGLVSTGIATVLGSLLAFGLARFRIPLKAFTIGLLRVPIFIPDIVMAVALLMFYSLARQWFGLFELGLPTMIVAHVTFQIPFVTIVVGARLAGMDPSLEEASRDLGANEIQTFLHVTLPLIAPGIIAASMLAFTLSLDDFVVSFFTSGPGSTTLPILIYSSVKRGITPDINALSTFIIAISMAATLAATVLQRSWKYRSIRDI